MSIAAQVSSRKTIGNFRVRWDDQRAAAAYRQGWWTNETLVDALSRVVGETPDRTLIVDGQYELDAQTLHAKARLLANRMVRRLPAGSVVSFMLPNWHETAIVYLATTMAGMVSHPLLPNLRDHDLLFILRDVRSRMIFTPAEFRGFDYDAMMRRVIAQLEEPPEVVIIRGDPGPHTAFDNVFSELGDEEMPPLDPDAVRMILYTSGTTGTPKGVMHSHNSIHALIRQLGQNWLIDEGDTFIVPSPISHIGGSIYAFECPLLLGTRAVLMDKWEPDRAVALIDRARCTHIAGATPFLDQLLSAAQAAESKLSSLKVFICGGASIPPSLIRKAAAYFQSAAVTRVYGSTEVPVTCVGTLDIADVDHAADTDGKIGIAEVKLLDSNGTRADEGELYARGPQMLVGYLHEQDEETVFDEDGYYRSGDLAQLVDGQYVLINGRAKDIIIRNGENISPKEVEDLLVDHPDIAEVAIVGVPDPDTGERACAVIVPRAQATPDLQSVRSYLEKLGIAKFKIPERIELWAALPKNDIGKVLKHTIVKAL